MNTPPSTASAHSSPPPRRRGWRWLGLIALAFVVVLGLSLVWILNSQSGAGWALARVQGALDGKLSVARHSGTLSGPLQLEDLRYVDAGAGIDAHVDKIVVDPDLLALFGKIVEIRAATIDGLRLDLTRVPDNPNKPPTALSMRAPIDIVINQLTLRDATVMQDGEPVFVADSLALVANWTTSGIAVRQLDLRSPDGQVALNGSLVTAPGYSGSGETTFNWKIGDVALAGVLKSSSDGKRAQLQLDLTEPSAATLVMNIGQSRDAPWTLQLDAPEFESKKILPDSTIGALSLHLQGSGNRETGSLKGTATVNGHQVNVDPLRYALTDGVLKIETLKLSSPEAAGSFEVHGELGYAAKPISANLIAAWQDVELPEDLVGQILATKGRLDLSGDLGGFDARGDLSIGPPGQPADIGIDIHGSEELITINSASLKQGQGGLDAKGTIRLKPELGWEINALADKLDPGAFAADWSGALDFVLASSGQLTDKGPKGVLKIDSLSGSLRQHPISGSADLSMAPGYIVDGSLAINSGDSRLAIEGKGGNSTDARFHFDIVSLGDFLPDSDGKLKGNFHVAGTWPQLDIDGEASGSNLAFAGVQVSSVELVTRLKNLDRPAGALTLKASNIAQGDILFDSLTLEADGNKSAHQLKLDAKGTPANIRFALTGSGDITGWKGQLESLALVPGARNLPMLGLAHPAAMDWDGQRFALSQSCLVGSPQKRSAKSAQDQQEVAGNNESSDEPDQPELPARLCLDGNFGKNGNLAGHYQLDHLPLRLLLRLAAPETPVRLRGELTGEGEFNRNANGTVSGQARIQSSEGKLFFSGGGDQPALVYSGFNLTADMGTASTVVQVKASLDHDGRIDGRLTINPVEGGSSMLDGYLKIDLNSLAFLELVTSEVSNTQGSLHADYTIAGTLAAPRLDGALNLTDFATELPSAGLTLSQGTLSLRATDSEHFVLEGRVTSGSGILAISGQGTLAPDSPMTITIKGENFLAADIPAAKVIITPDLSIERTKDGIFVKGKITIPSADVDLAKLPGGGTSAASADVVVVDAGEPKTARRLPITSHVTVVLGDKVKLTGFGFDGKIAGELSVSDRPGRVTTGNGALDATGTYYAYGQNLQIETGRVLFANTPIDNPALDIRAVRRIESESLTAGLNVRGSAQQPELTVFSLPARDSADALSYLMTGAPLTGGASFTFGRYLSPKLYLSYGVGIFEPGEVVTLRYLFNKKWNFEAVNATKGNRAGINYRIEK